MKYFSNIAHRTMMLNGTTQINQPILKKCFIVPAPIRNNLQLTAITPVNSENGKCYGKPGSSDYYIVIPCCFCKLVYSDFMFLLAVASVPCIASSSFPQPAHLASEWRWVKEFIVLAHRSRQDAVCLYAANIKRQWMDVKGRVTSWVTKAWPHTANLV